MFAVLLHAFAFAQKENPVQPGSTTEQQLENLTEQTESETEDDSFLQALDQFKKNPLNLNTATGADLKELRLITDLQIHNLLRYRKLLGNLIDVYELQAVPGWDVETIRKIIPYVQVGSASMVQNIGKRLAGGQHSLLVRMQQVLEKSEGFTRPDSIDNRYPGSPQRVFFRYKYVYRTLLQYGITGDKDAGEQFFKGAQKNGFDFYSAHFFARKLGVVKALALGDFSVNLGQGLTHWQSLAFRKSADVMNVKRQAEILRPYNSPTEYDFERGAGITLGFKHIDVTAFGSIRKLDASFNTDTLQTTEDFVSSLLTTGYHRTPLEVDKKDRITEKTAGGNVSYNNGSLHVGVNGVAYAYSVPLVKDVQVYNQYAIQGKQWHNYSFDYGYTYKNVHVFGEAAMDKNKSKAFIGGLLASIDPRVDLSLVYRNIEASYQSLYGNAFTESTSPSNEKGLYTGLTVRPTTFLRVDAYADMFSFPWLRYRVDAPTAGSEYLLQVTYKPNKQVEVYTRFRNENKAINLSGTDLPVHLVVIRPKQNWRTQVSYAVSREVTVRTRAELLWLDAHEKERAEQGFLSYVELKYKPFFKPLSANVRLQYFETDGFDSRLYAFESDVLYSYSIPQFIGKGLRYYVNLNYDVSKKLSVWLRWAQTVYSNTSAVGSGLDEIPGNKKTEVKVQAMYLF